MAECDEVAFDIIAGVTSELEVVHLESAHASAGLAPPSVALEHLSV